jgi:hypothetical protein
MRISLSHKDLLKLQMAMESYIETLKVYKKTGVAKSAEKHLSRNLKDSTGLLLRITTSICKIENL